MATFLPIRLYTQQDGKECLETVEQILKKLNIHLLQDPVILLLNVHKKKYKTCPHKDMQANGHNIIHSMQILEMIQCAPSGEWINRMRYHP